jgi:hypothetical protein
MFYCILISEFFGYNIESRIMCRVVKQRRSGYVARAVTIRSVYGQTYTSDLQKGVIGWH